MRALLALIVPFWLGAGGGALLGETVPAFWAFWALCGVGIALTLARHHREAHS